MSADRRLPADLGEVADLAGSGDAGLRRDDTASSDDDVVADLHEIVDLGALANNCVSQRAAINSRIGANLYIVLNDDTP